MQRESYCTDISSQFIYASLHKCLTKETHPSHSSRCHHQLLKSHVLLFAIGPTQSRIERISSRLHRVPAALLRYRICFGTNREISAAQRFPGRRCAHSFKMTPIGPLFSKMAWGSSRRTRNPRVSLRPTQATELESAAHRLLDSVPLLKGDTEPVR